MQIAVNNKIAIIDTTTFLNLFDVVDLGFQSENKKLILSSMDRYVLDSCPSVIQWEYDKVNQ